MSHSHREQCGAPGKAPILADWTRRGVPTEDEVVKWFDGNSNINIGLILGDTGEWNLVGVDVDGQVGEELLEEHAKGILPPTWEYLTGNGRRLIYLLPEGAPSKKKAEKGEDGELAFLATGQQTVLPPSIHPSGRLYEWKKGHSPYEIDIADAPQWLLNQVMEENTNDQGANLIPQELKQTVESDDWTKTVGKGERNNHLTKLAGSLIARRNIPKEQIVEFLKTWNQKHCDPPLPDHEIDVMVENLHQAEHQKAQKIQEQKKDKEPLRPTLFIEKFVEEQEKQNIGWRFCVDRGLFYRCDLVTGPWEPVDALYVQKALRKELIKQDPRWDSQRNVNEAYYALKEYLADPKNDHLFDIGQHPDLNHVYLANGMLDWRTLELKDWNPETYSTIQLQATWDPDAKNSEAYEKWENVLAQWLPDKETRDFLQEYVGYCLIPDASHRTAVFLYGAGSNGKSLFLDVVSKLFQGYISFVPLHWIGERFESAKLMDKLINVCGDIDSKYMTETSTLKAMIAGDPIRAEFKHGKSFHFHPVARLMFSANQLPRASDKSEGWYSRWKFIEFPRRFKTDTKFKRDLMTTFSTREGLSALLVWAIEGLRRLNDMEEFTVSETMADAENQYRIENDSVHAFATQILYSVPHEGKETQLTIPSAYHVYRVWCDDMGVKPVSRHEFVRRCGALDIDKGPRMVNKQSVNCLLGVKFSPMAKDAGYVEEYKFQESVRSTAKQRAQV